MTIEEGMRIIKKYCNGEGAIMKGHGYLYWEKRGRAIPKEMLYLYDIDCEPDKEELGWAKIVEEARINMLNKYTIFPIAKKNELLYVYRDYIIQIGGNFMRGTRGVKYPRKVLPNILFFGRRKDGVHNSNRTKNEENG